MMLSGLQVVRIPVAAIRNMQVAINFYAINFARRITAKLLELPLLAAIYLVASQLRFHSMSMCVCVCEVYVSSTCVHVCVCVCVRGSCRATS